MMTDIIAELEQVPEALDNATLQRMMNEHMKEVDANNGEGTDLDLSLYIIANFDFSGLSLSGVHAYKTVFQECRFVGTDLYTADFSNTVAPGTDFRKAVLAKSVFYGANLSGANFDGANLMRAYFKHCDLRGTTFRDVDFSGGMISDCQMEGAIYDPEKVQPL